MTDGRRLSGLVRSRYYLTVLPLEAFELELALELADSTSVPTTFAYLICTLEISV